MNGFTSHKDYISQIINVVQVIKVNSLWKVIKL